MAYKIMIDAGHGERIPELCMTDGRKKMILFDWLLQ